MNAKPLARMTVVKQFSLWVKRLMSSIQPSAEKHKEIHFPLSLWIIASLALIVRLLMMGWNEGEYTDGIIQLQLWESSVVFFPPGYSALVWGVDFLVGDLLRAGRLVSILASVGSIFLVYRITGRVFRDERIALWAAILFLLSPIPNRWALRVMTDSLFCFFFLVCCDQIFCETKNRGWRLLGWAGIASLVRYQGFYFVPIGVFLLYKDRWKPGSRRQVGMVVAALIPWILLIWWVSLRGFGHHEQFAERASMGMGTTILLYYLWMENFVLYWPWALSYGLFALSLVGCWKMSQGEEKGFLYFTMITSLVFLLVQSAFLSFQYRYFLPLTPLWCILAARGWMKIEEGITFEWFRKGIQTFVLANLIFMTAGVMILQRDTFGALAQSAKALQTIGRGSRVLSDEVYRQGVYNVKMKFWSGRDMELYQETEPRVGDIVVLHNTYSNLQEEQKRLSERFSIKVLGRWTYYEEEGGYNTIPLLPDIMVRPKDPPQTSNPSCMAFRFLSQGYYSVVLRLEEKRETSS